MKKIFIATIFLLSACIAMATMSERAGIFPCQDQLRSIQSDSLIIGIQSKITSAFIQGLMSQNDTLLKNLSEQLESLNKVKNIDLIIYWRSYLKLYSSIYYLIINDKKNAENEIDKGIEWMEIINKKNSEDYALLAYMQSFSIQFKGMKTMAISENIKKNANSAMTLDSANLRANYVYASIDFYTPKKYGSGKEAEKYLLKAISLPAQKIENGYLPSWGKEESYEMLIKLYIRNEKWDLAQKSFQEGIAAFPKSYTINQLASKLAGK